METTKKSMEPALKETYGSGVKPQANRSVMKDFRLCPACGKKRMGSYCRECGSETQKRGGRK